ncbi:MAG: Mrp/NBP35 family ATP-binding protein [Butyrivibrio sp.]|nr:Mrp/NBP35 family ATP-binding protein [Butyrivibrio sp.]
MAEEKKVKSPEEFKKQMEDNMKAAPNADARIKKVIGVVSGKGGVGKSFVTSLSAMAMNKSGFSTGILDADITGPSIPKMFGMGHIEEANDFGIIPGKSKNGIKMVSINMLNDSETQPVIWRGPIIANVVKQFWSEVDWGDVDYLFVDMPPGTGDVPITVFQSLPVDGIIIVTTPQELVSMIVEKAINMANMMNIPVLGIVENMSYMVCPCCNEKINVFGESHIDEYASSKNIEVLAKIPMDSKIAQLGDNGNIEEYDTSLFSGVLEKLKNI